MAQADDPWTPRAEGGSVRKEMADVTQSNDPDRCVVQRYDPAEAALMNRGAEILAARPPMMDDTSSSDLRSCGSYITPMSMDKEIEDLRERRRFTRQRVGVVVSSAIMLCCLVLSTLSDGQNTRIETGVQTEDLLLSAATRQEVPPSATTQSAMQRLLGLHAKVAQGEAAPPRSNVVKTAKVAASAPAPPPKVIFDSHKHVPSIAHQAASTQASSLAVDQKPQTSNAITQSAPKPAVTASNSPNEAQAPAAAAAKHATSTQQAVLDKFGNVVRYTSNVEPEPKQSAAIATEKGSSKTAVPLHSATATATKPTVQSPAQQSQHQAAPTSPTVAPAAPFKPQNQAPPTQYQAPPTQYQAPPTQYQAPPAQYQAPPAQYQAEPAQYQAAPVQYEAPAVQEQAQYGAPPAEYQQVQPAYAYQPPQQYQQMPAQYQQPGNPYQQAQAQYQPQPQYMPAPQYAQAAPQYQPAPAQYQQPPTPYQNPQAGLYQQGPPVQQGAPVQQMYQVPAPRSYQAAPAQLSAAQQVISAPQQLGQHPPSPALVAQQQQPAQPQPAAQAAAAAGALAAAAAPSALEVHTPQQQQQQQQQLDAPEQPQAQQQPQQQQQQQLQASAHNEAQQQQQQQQQQAAGEAPTPPAQQQLQQQQMQQVQQVQQPQMQQQQQQQEEAEEEPEGLQAEEEQEHLLREAHRLRLQRLQAPPLQSNPAPTSASLPALLPAPPAQPQPQQAASVQPMAEAAPPQAGVAPAMQMQSAVRPPQQQQQPQMAQQQQQQQPELVNGKQRMVVDGAAADVGSLQLQASQQASETLRASLGTDTPQQNAFREQMRQRMIQEEEQNAKATADTEEEEEFGGMGEVGEESAQNQAPQIGTAQMKSQANPNLIRMAFT